jgi:hypothetical protein
MRLEMLDTLFQPHVARALPPRHLPPPPPPAAPLIVVKYDAAEEDWEAARTSGIRGSRHKAGGDGGK